MVERYNRDAIPVSVLVLTIIGAVLASRKVRGGSGFHLAVGVIISVLYILSAASPSCSPQRVILHLAGRLDPQYSIRRARILPLPEGA